MRFNRLVKRPAPGVLCLVFLVGLICLLSNPSFAQVQPQVDLTPKNVLILHSFEGNAPVFMGTDRGLANTLLYGGIPSLNQFFQSLDLRRNPGPEHRKLLVEQMRMRYGHRKIDMIITMYPEALEFVRKDCRDFLPDVPILALYLPQKFEVLERGRRIIGHYTKLDSIGTIEIALKLVPGAKRVYVVSGAHELDRKIGDLARGDWKKWEGRLEFHYLGNMPLDDMLATVSNTPPGSIIIVLAFSQEVTGKNQTTPAVARRLSEVSTAPIFGILDAMLGHGITGGSLISFELVGTKAGQLTLDILRGTKTQENIPNFLDVPPVPMFDWRQLRRWNLSESALPKGSIIINRETTFWDYKYYIIGGIVVLLAQTILVIGLLVQRRRKKAAEESLRQKTEELDQFFNVTLDLLGIANTDGYFLRLNPAVERLLGYTREELMARPFFDFVHPDDLDSTREAVSTLAAQQKIFLFENRYRCKDGTYRWLEWSSAPAGRLIYAAARDITEHKRAEQALEERLRFETLLAEISAHFVNLPSDQIDREIEDAQRRICELLNLDRSTLWQVPEREPGTLLLTHFYQPPGTLPLPEQVDAKDFWPWTVQKILNGETVIISKMTDLPPEAGRDRESFRAYDTKSGVYVPLSVGEGPVFGLLTFALMREEKSWPETVVQQFELVAQIYANALARKRAEAEIARARTELLHVERSLRLNEMTASLAHELNQPLAAILSNAQAALRFLKSDKPDLNEFQEIMRDIISDDQRAGNVIRSLRSMMKREEGEKRPTILNDILNDVIQIFRSEAILRNVSIETELDGSLPPVFGDKGQLQQVVLNLIMNGVEAMSRNPPEQRKLILRAQRKDHSIWVTVRDFGPGIDKENLERVFQPFFTTKGTGLGMGLAVCSSIIRDHRGRIWAENNPDGGGTFFIELPIDKSSK